MFARSRGGGAGIAWLRFSFRFRRLPAPWCPRGVPATVPAVGCRDGRAQSIRRRCPLWSRYWGGRQRARTVAPVTRRRVTRFRFPFGRRIALGRTRGIGDSARRVSRPSNSRRRAGLGDRYVHPDSAEARAEPRFLLSPYANSPAAPPHCRADRRQARGSPPPLLRKLGGMGSCPHRRRLEPAGELEAQTKGVVDDSCQASCVDWYGNARPIFWGGRTFALLGYELVEGELARGRVREVARISFAPAPTRQ